MTRQADLPSGGGKHFEGLRWYDGRWQSSDALNGPAELLTTPVDVPA